MRAISFAVLVLLTLPALAAQPTPIDYADASQVDAWLRHPVYGDPSFDAFERDAGNPIRRGKPPFAWPVNGFFFRDPVSGNWYVYVGDYVRGYVGAAPSRCFLLRSRDTGKTWEPIGEVLPRDPGMFDGDGGKRAGHMPDVSVAYDPADKRYHMLYDWGIDVMPGDPRQDGGIAYAVAERPEGPFVRDKRPLQTWKTTKLILGRYNRPYAQTLIRRKDDWLILADMDHAPNSWAIYAMTSKAARGPYSEPVLVRHVEDDYFHPPLMEGYPAFVHDGYVYAPTTSVARTRNFNCIFRAPLERAHEEAAWELWRHGSVWHAEDVENEHFGIWGQTFSGFVDDRDGVLHTMFPCRDENGMGTINLAHRKWDQPLKNGFHLSGNAGPSMTLLRKTYGDFELGAQFTLRGTAQLMWDHNGLLGPSAPTSDAIPHPLSQRRTMSLTLGSKEGTWSVTHSEGQAVEAAGKVGPRSDWHIALRRRGETMQFSLDGKTLWEGNVPMKPGGVGWYLQPDTHLSVSRFQITGEPRPATRTYFYMEALLDHGEALADWQERAGADAADFHANVGAVSKSGGQAVKWSVTGKRLRLWSPKGPDYGTVEFKLDGKPQGVVDLHEEKPTASSVIWTSEQLDGDYHAVVVQGKSGRFPVDSLEVED